MKRVKSGKISYKVRRWNSSGFHYGRTITIEKETFNNIVKSFNHENREISLRLNRPVEYTTEGVYPNITQTQFIAHTMGLKLKDGYNTFFKWVQERENESI